MTRKNSSAGSLRPSKRRLGWSTAIMRERVWKRATHLVWLDYERAVIMARVISRSLLRAFLRTELWAGNRERWRHMLHPSHPIRWAWSTWERRRRETAEWLLQTDYAHLRYCGCVVHEKSRAP